MNFLAPTALAFAAAIPVVIVFYLLKRKRVLRLVSSTVLWQRFLAETQASAPFQKLRHNWLLLLQILLLALVVLALARPYFAAQVRGGRLLVAILDASASMQSRDVSPSRFEAARSRALDLIDSLHDSDRLAILVAGAQTEVRQSPTSNKTALRRATRSATVSDAPARITEALRLAQSLTRDRGDAEIHLFSDGALIGLEEFEHEGLNLLYHRVGLRADNRGIVAMDVRSHPDNPDQQAVFATVANFSTNTARTRLELRFDNQMLESRLLEFNPRESLSQIFAVQQPSDGLYELRLTDDDDLAVDNVAWAPALRPQPARVLLVSAGNRFLERALLALPRVELTVTPLLTGDPADFDLTVLDNVTPLAWPAGNLLAFRVAPPDWLDPTGELDAPAIMDWRSSHPLLRFVNLDNVAIATARAANPAPWAVPLVESATHPLLLAGEQGARRFVWIAFDSLQSTWPLRISFPIFIANAVDWLNPVARRAERFQIRPGDPIRLPSPPNLAEVRLQTPDSSTHILPVPTDGREIVFGNTSRRGIYTLEAGDQRFHFCANLLDAHESDIQPRDELVLGRYARAEATRRELANLEWWRWLAALGLAVLLFEWWWYHKRTV